MLIIDTKDSDSIDKALRKYKKKFERSGVLKQLRQRQAYKKPSIVKRHEKLKAIYRDKVLAGFKK